MVDVMDNYWKAVGLSNFGNKINKNEYVYFIFVIYNVKYLEICYTIWYI